MFEHHNLKHVIETMHKHGIADARKALKQEIERLETPPSNILEKHGYYHERYSFIQIADKLNEILHLYNDKLIAAYNSDNEHDFAYHIEGASQFFATAINLFNVLRDLMAEESK